MWNACEKIIENRKKIVDFDVERAKAFQDYVFTLGGINPKTIWYDTIEKVCFGEDTTFRINPNDFCFFARKEDFINDSYWGDIKIQEPLGIPLGNERIVTSEYIMSYREDWKKYTNKTILIVAAGPSTLDTHWDSIGIEYDYLWTCNKFFFNDRVMSKQIDLAVLGPEVNLFDPSLIKKIKSDSTLCLFEGGVTPYRSHAELDQFVKLHPGRVGYVHTRFFSKLGAGARLLPLAFFLGAKNIYFVGIDGHPVELKHAFEGDGKKHQGAPLVRNSYNIYRRQFTLLWDYLISLNARAATYYNLGEGFQYNQSRDMTLDHFPLPKDIAASL
jgi:hypothetical protein